MKVYPGVALKRISTAKVLVMIAVLGFGLPVLSLNADEVVMKDGGALDGTVVRQTDDQLTLKLPSGEEKSIPREDVDYFTVQRTKITLTSDDTLTGRVVEEDEEKTVLDIDRAGQVELQNESIEKKEEVTLKFAGSPPGKKLPLEGPTFWSGSFDLGYAITRGNSEEDDFFVRGRLSYERKPVVNETTAKYNYATSEDETTKDRAETENQLNYFLGENAFLYHDLTVGYDNVKSLDYFVDTSAGAGVEFLVDQPPVLKVRSGPSYRFEKREGADDESELFLLIAESFETALNDRITFRQELKLFPSLTDTGEFRQEATAELKIALSSNWSLNLYGEQEYDSDPVPGKEKTDLRFVSTLGYSF